jgi:hypothetical protein
VRLNSLNFVGFAICIVYYFLSPAMAAGPENNSYYFFETAETQIVCFPEGSRTIVIPGQRKGVTLVPAPSLPQNTMALHPDSCMNVNYYMENATKVVKHYRADFPGYVVITHGFHQDYTLAGLPAAADEAALALKNVIPEGERIYDIACYQRNIGHDHTHSYAMQLQDQLGTRNVVYAANKPGALSASLEQGFESATPNFKLNAYGKWTFDSVNNSPVAFQPASARCTARPSGPVRPSKGILNLGSLTARKALSVADKMVDPIGAGTNAVISKVLSPCKANFATLILQEGAQIVCDEAARDYQRLHTYDIARQGKLRTVGANDVRDWRHGLTPSQIQGWGEVRCLKFGISDGNSRDAEMAAYAYREGPAMALLYNGLYWSGYYGK